MQFIKKVIKRTYLYGTIQGIRARKDFQRRAKNVHGLWTAHDQEMFEFYSKFISRGALCFDIGANVGDRVKTFLKLRANIVAVEPQEECVKILRTVYGNNRNLKIVQKAIGESEGEAEMMVCNVNTISSLSPEWIKSVRKSGRFSEYSWDKKMVVAVTTLDRLIEQYGTPSFIKIDVEGFEYPVVKGLSQPVKTLSLEFTPEFIESTFKCIDHLQQLGDIHFNYSVGETMQLAMEEWVSSQEMVKILSSFRDDNTIFGDVYGQFLNPGQTAG